MSQDLDQLSSLLKLVSEQNRLKLLCLLQHGEHCVCEILEHYQMSQSLTSHHLADLKQAGLVKSHKDGRKALYSLTAKGRTITKKIISLINESKSNL